MKEGEGDLQLCKNLIHFLIQNFCGEHVLLFLQGDHLALILIQMQHTA